MKTTAFILLVAIAGLWGCSTEEQKDTTATTESTDSTSAIASGDNMAGAVTERKTNLSQVQVGMKDEKVRAVLGGPSKIEVINPEVGARVEDWWYGNNQKVRMTGGQVTRVISDVAKEQETLQKINEAKAKGDDAEAERLLEEIDKNN